MADSEDQFRVWAVIDGVGRPVTLSQTDIARAVQPTTIEHIENAWGLLRSEMPELMKKAMVKYEEEKAEALAKARAEYLERHPPPKSNPIKAFILDNWGWVVAIAVIVGVLRPEWIKYILVHLVGI